MMSGIVKSWPAAAVAGALVALAASGCGREPGVAGKGEVESRRQQQRGEQTVPSGHAHGGTAEPAAGGAMPHQEEHGDHAGMEHGRQSAAPGEHGAHGVAEHGRHAPAPSAQGGHAGHGAMAPQTRPAEPTPPAAGHAGHAPSRADARPAPFAPEPAAVAPGQPAATLRPDALDAPAATSLIEAERSAEMAREMAGGHGAHGAGTYRQVDAGRGPEAHEAPERAEPPGAPPPHHQHGAPQPPKEPDKPPEHQHDPPGSSGSQPAAGRRR